MSLRTASGFLEALRDDREIWLEGERVKDVTTHPRLRGAALTIAELYGMQHEPTLRDRLSVALDDGTGERIGYSHIAQPALPRSGALLLPRILPASPRDRAHARRRRTHDDARRRRRAWPARAGHRALLPERRAPRRPAHRAVLARERCGVLGVCRTNVLYERFFAGDPWRVGSITAARYPLQDELKQRVWTFLERTREWDARLGGSGTTG